MKKILLITALSVCFIGGCQTDSRTDSQATKNTMTPTDTETQWQLTQFDGKTIKKTNPQAELPYIILQEKDNKVVGLAGCNRFFGSYRLHKNQLKFSHFGMTMMACYDLPVPEHQFIQALENTDSYMMKGNQLMLKQGDKILAVFRAISK